jgi:hypothetical protein
MMNGKSDLPYHIFHFSFVIEPDVLEPDVLSKKRKAANSLLAAFVMPLPTAHCPLPTAHCPLPTAYCFVGVPSGFGAL